MKPRLYVISFSHPARAARLMLEHKGIDHDLVKVPVGMQAIQLRLLGFRGGTIPALRIGRRRLTGSREIARALDEFRPDPPLFPADPAHRREVEEAEAWGERVLQPIPRRALRWALRHRETTRAEFAEMLGAPRMAPVMLPVAVYYARREDAGSTARIREDRAALPAHLDHVDALIGAGTIGGEALNAADFQIGTTLRVMLALPDFAPLVEGRPAEHLARRIWPDFRFRAPRLLPADL